MKTEKKRSEVWKFFTRVSVNESSCNICDKVCKSSGNTTNLRNHLRSKHIHAFTALLNFSEDLDGVCASERMEWSDCHNSEMKVITVESKNVSLNHERDDEGEGELVNEKVEMKRKYKRKKKEPNPIPEVIKSLCIPETPPAKSEFEHELDIFGRCIAAQLKKLPERKAIQLTLDINNLVGEARLEDIEEQMANKASTGENPHVITVSYGNPTCSNSSDNENTLEIMHE